MPKPKRDDYASLKDIQQALIRIQAYVYELTYDEFIDDTKTQDAVIRNLEIIGEAAKNISNELKTIFSQINWKGLAGLRDRLIHHYFGVNIDIVWIIITKELHGILEGISKILMNSKKQNPDMT